MATIKVYSDGRTFECALNFALIEENILCIASYAGQPSAVWAISACAIEGRRMYVIDDKGDVYDLRTSAGMYRRIERKAGDVWHGMFIHKNAVYYENCQTPLIISLDGDVESAVGKFIVSKFAVPAEWQDDYIKILDYKRLWKIKSSVIDHWSRIEAVKITGVMPGMNDLTEENLLQGIEKALKKGFLKIPESEAKGSFDPSWTARDYLKANAVVLAEQVKQVKPRHDFTEKLNPAIAQMDRIPFPAQAHVIQGLVNALEHENMVVACGDMGTGKSIISLGVCNVLYKQKNKGMAVLISSPGIMVPKWEKGEIAETLPDAKVYTIRSTEDAARYLRMVREGHKPEGLEFVLVGIDRAKLGPDPWCSAIWKEIHPGSVGAQMKRTREFAWHCPSCMKPIGERKDDYIAYADWNTFAWGEAPEESSKKTPNGLPEGFRVKWKLPARIKKCPNCSSPLWRPALKSRGETPNKPRWFVSLILKKLRRYFDLYVCDEVHQAKAQDSGRGDAFAQMVKAGKKTLCLTGTLLNGMSTSIKEIIWRTDPKSLIREGFDHRSGMVVWARRYGVLEHIVRESEDDDGIHTRRKKSELQPREKPGIAPDLVANHLLHRAAFLELGDLELPLVELKEVPVFVEMDDDHAEAYEEFHARLHDACKRAYNAGIRGAFSRFIPATINYADRPDLGANVALKKKDGKIFAHVSAPEFDPGYEHAKERELVKLVQENLAEERGCIIYCNYTDSYAVHHRLRDVLKNNGIEAHVLESHVSPEKRVEWLAQKEEEGAKVIICNMRLVEVGLDLLPWPTIIFYQLSYDINTVRQASRRAWRIGQTRECRIYYLIYEDTQQQIQFEYCMVKRAHAMLAEGRLDRSELARFGRDDKSALAADLAECLASDELKKKWTELAEKDRDEELEMVEESHFRDVLKKAQQKLVKKTLALCGIEEEVEIEEPEVKVLDLSAFVPKRRKSWKKRKMPEGFEQPSLLDLIAI